MMDRFHQAFSAFAAIIREAYAVAFEHFRSILFYRAEYSRIAEVLQALFITFCVNSFLFYPSPGVAAVVLGLAAGVMAVRAPGFSKAEQVVWIGILTALAVVEIVAVKRAQDYSDAMQAQLRMEDRVGRRLEHEQFNAMLQEFSKVLKSTRAIENLSEENLKNITGANSVPYIVPQTHAGVDPIPLEIWDQGKYILSGVTVIIRNAKDYGDTAAFLNRPELTVGVVHPGFGRMLSQGISPHIDSSGEDIYDIEISTQGDSYSEVLHFRRNKYASIPGALPWAYKFWVYRHRIISKSRKRTSTVSEVVLDRSKWSDDEGDGIPTWWIVFISMLRHGYLH